MIIHHEFNLIFGNKFWIPLSWDNSGRPDPNGPHHADAVSIQTHNPNGLTLDSGVITVKKANMPTGLPVDINSTAVTITAPGVKELTLNDFARAGYLVLDVTTASSSQLLLHVAVALKKFAFPVELGIDGGGA